EKPLPTEDSHPSAEIPEAMADEVVAPEQAPEPDDTLVVNPTWHRLSGTDVGELVRETTPSEELDSGDPGVDLGSVSGEPPPGLGAESSVVSGVCEGPPALNNPLRGKFNSQDQESRPDAGPLGADAGEQK